MTRRFRCVAVTGAVVTVLASAACTGDRAGVEVAPESHATSDPAVRPKATIDAAAVEPLRAAAALDPCPTLDGASAPASGSGDGLPAVALSCLGDGPAVPLGSLRGPYVINIWGSWCAECSDEAPYLAEVYADPGRAVGFLGIDYLDDPAAGLQAAAALGMKYPAVWSDDDSLRVPLRIVGAPLTLFIDGDGRVVGRKAGAFESAAELRAQIDRYLGPAQ